MINLESVLENLLASDLLIIFQYQWVPILLEARKDIELLVIICLWNGLCLLNVS